MEEQTKNLCRHPCFTICIVFNWQFFNVLEAPWFQGFPDHNRHLFVTSITINTVSLSLECFPIQQMLTPCQFFSSCMRYHISVFVRGSRSSWQIQGVPGGMSNTSGGCSLC
jgi:hypothetical protein